MTASALFTAAHATARLADAATAYRARFVAALKATYHSLKQTLNAIMEPQPAVQLPASAKNWNHNDRFNSSVEAYADLQDYADRVMWAQQYADARALKDLLSIQTYFNTAYPATIEVVAWELNGRGNTKKFIVSKPFRFAENDKAAASAAADAAEQEMVALLTAKGIGFRFAGK